jgi:hypothetical protein
MEISISHKNVQVTKVTLGKSFANITTDVVIDRYGRVKVSTGPTFFYTDLTHIPREILKDVSERLKTEANNRILEKIQKRINNVIVAG